METEKQESIARVIVVGGGIGGIQCALDLADAGFYVDLVEKTPTLGGTMARLDKTFPTNDCSTCMFSPKLAQVARHEYVRIMTQSRLLELEGEPGHFTARIERQPRFIDETRCIAFLACVRTCPFQVPAMNEDGVSEISPSGCRGCGICTSVCPRRAITLKHATDEQMNAKIDALLAPPGDMAGGEVLQGSMG